MIKPFFKVFYYWPNGALAQTSFFVADDYETAVEEIDEDLIQKLGAVSYAKVEKIWLSVDE